jgi:hypothetical protein
MGVGRCARARLSDAQHRAAQWRRKDQRRNNFRRRTRVPLFKPAITNNRSCEVFKQVADAQSRATATLKDSVYLRATKYLAHGSRIWRSAALLPSPASRRADRRLQRGDTQKQANRE